MGNLSYVVLTFTTHLHCNGYFSSIVKGHVAKIRGSKELRDLRRILEETCVVRPLGIVVYAACFGSKHDDGVSRYAFDLSAVSSYPSSGKIILRWESRESSQSGKETRGRGTARG